MTRPLPLGALLGALLCLASAQARAQEATPEATPAPEATPEPTPSPEASAKPEERKPDDSISEHRSAVDALVQRTIGRTSRRLVFDWRRNTAQVGLSVGYPAELNSFNSVRLHAFGRFPIGNFRFDMGLAWVFVNGSSSSRKLELTPHRQAGRPARLELDLGFAYPLAEGVVTALPTIVPEAELVLNLIGEFRYFIYPNSWDGLNGRETAAAVFSPQLSGKERRNLEGDRLGGMEIDRARYHLLFGLGNDIYFRTGIFVSFELLLALPILEFMTSTKLLFGLDFTLGVGYAF